MDGTSIIQGTFAGTGNPVFLNIRQDVDWMMVRNMTVASTTTPNILAGGFDFYWQRGMAAGTGIRTLSTVTTGVLANSPMASNGFTLIDTSANGAFLAVTGLSLAGITNATPPVVAVADTSLIAAGDVIYMTLISGGTQLSTIPFTVGTVVTNTSFELAYGIAAGAVAGPLVNAKVYRLPYPPQFYPRQRYITNMVVDPTNSNQTRITLSVKHQFNVGEKVRLIVPSQFVLTGFNEVECTIRNVLTSATLNYIDVDLPFATFALGGTFAFPAYASSLRLQPAQVVPVGENVAAARALNVNEFLSAFNNRSFIGMQLGAGINYPGGASGNTMYWRAGKSYLNDSTESLVMTQSNM